MKALCPASMATFLVEDELYGSALQYHKMAHELAPNDIKFILPLAMNYYQLEDFVMAWNLMQDCINMEISDDKQEMEYKAYCHQFLELINDKIITEDVA